MNLSNGCSLIWFRHDLRVRDQQTLTEAVKDAAHHQRPLLAVYFFEPRLTGADRFGQERMGVYRAMFLLETLKAHKQDLRALNIELLVLEDDPRDALPALIKRVNAQRAFASRHVTDEECEQELLIREQLKDVCPLSLYWTHTLYTQRQLPFSLGDLPDVYTQFRKKVERSANVTEPLVPPQVLAPQLRWALDSGEPQCQLSSLWSRWSERLQAHGLRDERAAILLAGGAEAGEARVHDYCWSKGHVERYKDTRNGLIGADYSTKFSAWLSVGALSPRWVWWEVLRYEDERIANDSTYWVRFELLWREYFQWVALLYGSSLFKLGGLSADLGRSRPKKSYENARAFERWSRGLTGDDFVDANMKELNATGFMSNRGRQNVASYLVHDLNLDWRMGAGYFEAQLIDYDPASNWGNWAYIAGVGNDPRPQRKFNTRGQAERYDSQGRYRTLWSQ